MSKKSENQETKTYLIEQGNDYSVKTKRKITLPSSWKITYGKLHGGNSKSSGGNVLRVYETKEKQRAIFTDVITFIDLSIRVERLVVDAKEITEIKNSKNNKKYTLDRNEKQLWIEEF